MSGNVVMRPVRGALVRPLLRRPKIQIPRLSNYSTNPQETVQTPVQSQPKDTPPAPDAASKVVKTPFQSVDASKLSPTQYQRAKPEWGIKGPLYFLFGGLLVTQVMTYFYYQHRKEHMEAKKAKLIADAEEKYKAGG